MTLTHAYKHVKWLRSLLTEMGFGYMVEKPTKMIGDNKNATDWAVEGMISDGNRHIDIQYMKIREVVRKGEVEPVWIKGKMNPSDILTKAVDRTVIDELMKKLTGYEIIEGITERYIDGKQTTEAFALAMLVKLYYDIRAGKHYKMKL